MTLWHEGQTYCIAGNFCAADFSRFCTLYTRLQNEDFANYICINQHSTVQSNRSIFTRLKFGTKYLVAKSRKLKLHENFPPYNSHTKLNLCACLLKSCMWGPLQSCNLLGLYSRQWFTCDMPHSFMLWTKYKRTIQPGIWEVIPYSMISCEIQQVFKFGVTTYIYAL